MKRKELLKILLENKDEDYKSFNDKIINTNKKTIGVRIPILRQIAKKIMKEDYVLFLNDVKDEYHEEIIVEGLVISKLKDVNNVINMIDNYIIKIDNWCTCDTFASSLKIINKNKSCFYSYIYKNINSNNPWMVRLCFVILHSYYVKEEYINDIFKMIDNDNNSFYYVMMAKAWLISECYIKYPKQTFEYLKRTNIDDITFNKAISKICDSYRLTKEDKIVLKKMKKKSNIA